MWPSVSRLPTKLGSWASSYQLKRTVISQDHQPIAHQYPEIGDGEKIYAAEIGKCYKSGLFFFFLESQLLILTTAVEEK